MHRSILHMRSPLEITECHYTLLKRLVQAQLQTRTGIPGVGDRSRCSSKRAWEESEVIVLQLLKADVSKCRVPMPGHFSVEMRYKNHADAYHASFFPGVNAIDSHTVGFEADDYFEVLRSFSFCVA